MKPPALKYKIQNLPELFEVLPPDQEIILDIILGIINGQLPKYCKQKISYNVPYFYGNKGICIVWPAAIPRGGIKEGVLLGFWQGYLLKDPDNYLTKGTNKKIYYKIYTDPEEIEIKAISKLLDEAIQLDQRFKYRNK